MAGLSSTPAGFEPPDLLPSLHVRHRMSPGIRGGLEAKSPFNEPARGGIEIGVATRLHHSAAIGAPIRPDQEAHQDRSLGTCFFGCARVVGIDDAARYLAGSCPASAVSVPAAAALSPCATRAGSRAWSG